MNSIEWALEIQQAQGYIYRGYSRKKLMTMKAVPKNGEVSI